jgi:hypothetical protein
LKDQLRKERERDEVPQTQRIQRTAYDTGHKDDDVPLLK